LHEHCSDSQQTNTKKDFQSMILDANHWIA